MCLLGSLLCGTLAAADAAVHPLVNIPSVSPDTALPLSTFCKTPKSLTSFKPTATHSSQRMWLQPHRSVGKALVASNGAKRRGGGGYGTGLTKIGREIQQCFSPGRNPCYGSDVGREVSLRASLDVD
jgi:hypothetical protein